MSDYEDVVSEQEEIESLKGELPEEARLPILPYHFRASGLYTWSIPTLQPLPPRVPFPISHPVGGPRPIPRPIPDPIPGPLTTATSETVEASDEEDLSLPLWFLEEELRLDVDGRYPQMVASGTMYRGLSTRVHWVASLRARRHNHWIGSIWYKEGNTSSFAYSNIEVLATTSWFPNQRKVTAIFTGGGAPRRIRVYKYKSPYYRHVEFEFDHVAGATATTNISTGAHPNRPSAMPVENLSIEKVFRRAGLNVRKSGGDGAIPIAEAHAGATWSDMEMHDAMRTYWSRFDNRAQWSMWTLFAGLHDSGTSLGGIMFDDIGPNHRQGTAIFSDSFISNSPTGDPAPAAWVERMRFWTACHEMGHSFNLAHSWQKDHPPNWGTPWIPLSNENEERSFMNYPYRVAGGQTAFFADFAYRFSQSELLFMRHAPDRFVRMGGADWFDHHGFHQASVTPEPTFRLELRVNRDSPIYEFLEPVNLELKLTNISHEPQVVDDDVLSECDEMTVIIKKQSKAARQWSPFVSYLTAPSKIALGPGNSLYQSLAISAGRNGWDISEPGVYAIQIALHLNDEDIVSNHLKLRVAPPLGFEEEFIAQDFFSDDVGRVLAFNGSEVLTSANDTLRRVVDQFSKRKVALHARHALANPLTRDYKSLDLGAGSRPLTAAFEEGGAFKVRKAKADDARSGLDAALITAAESAVETFGNICYKRHIDRYSDWLAGHEQIEAATKCQARLQQTLAKRKVADWVLAGIEKRRGKYARKVSGKAKKSA